MEYKSTTLNSFEKRAKFFFLSLLLFAFEKLFTITCEI